MKVLTVLGGGLTLRVCMGICSSNFCIRFVVDLLSEDSGSPN
jgi:hypothetical protein